MRSLTYGMKITTNEDVRRQRMTEQEITRERERDRERQRQRRERYKVDEADVSEGTRIGWTF